MVALTEFGGGAVLERVMSASAGGAGAQSSYSAEERGDPARVQTEFARGFGDWLIGHQVGLVCSTSRTGYLLFIDLRNGDIVQWFRLRGDVTELFDVGVIANIRCPRGIGPDAPGLQEAMRGEGME